nr:hypothetical protein [Tanacetum cinerariifolium]
ECIGPRGSEIDWYYLVWFSHQILRHAIHLWLVIKRKLKTQDTLLQWDVSSNTNLNLIHCPLYKTQPDSYDHLFFKCCLSSHVWEHLKSLIGIPNMPSSLDLIVRFLTRLLRSALNVQVQEDEDCSDVAALLEVAQFSYSSFLTIADHYAVWLKLWPCADYLEVIPIEFFLGRFLRRQSQLAYFTPSMLLMARCGDSYLLKLLLPVGVLVSATS